MNQPQVGEAYRDDEGRTLHVHTVAPHNPLDRHVQGTLTSPGLPDEYPYSCSFVIFGRVWKEKVDAKPS